MAAFAAPAPIRRARASLHSKCTRASTRGDTPPPPSTPVAVSRRAALATAAAAALFQLAQVPPTRAATEDVTSTQFGYSFSMPSTGWTRSSADLSGMRTLTAFTRDADKTGATNVSMVETPLPGDFMKLTSFGPMESVLKLLVPDGQKGVSGDIISAEMDAKKNAYIVEYTLKVGEDAPVRHLLTVFSLQPGRYLLTLTGQTTEDLWASEQKTLREVAASYKIQYLD